MAEDIAPLLVLGWGNRSRGDDALGPLLIEHLGQCIAHADASRIEFLDEFQLQVEHALDLAGRQRVLFVDASRDCAAPFEVSAISAVRDASFTTHAMSPEAVLQVFRDVQGGEPPPCTLLAIRGERFELGEELTAAALANLAQATNWATNWIRTG